MSVRIISAVSLILLGVATLVAASGTGNPFAISGVKYYVNSDFLAEVQASVDMKGDSTWGEKAMKFAHTPSAYWLDTMAKVGKLMVMMEEAVNFAAQVNAPVLTSFVIYDVPTRDCYALSSNGEIQLTGKYDGPSGSSENGIVFYKSSYIDPIFSVIKRYDNQSPQIVSVLFIEPDSLPNIVTNKGSRNCSTDVCDAYITAQTYTIKALGQLKSAWMYMDLAHGGWLGYKDNLPKADGPFKTVLSGQENLIRGFVTNSANYSPLIFTTGWKDLTSTDTDYCLDELTYYGALMNQSSLFAGKNVIIDTGRNGIPGSRSVMGHWCNIYGTGLGKLPGLPGSRIDLSTQNCPDREQYGTNIKNFCVTNAAKGVKQLDALWWIKTPGESDGISENKPGARLDTMCQSNSSWWKSTKGSDAPEAGQWFHEFFVDLVSNAVEVPTDVDLCAPNPCKNLGVCKSGACTCAGGWTGKYCTTPPAECANNPCKNYATCHQGAGAAKCICAVGFSGTTCETTSGACDSAPGNQCFNGGVCSGSPWKCACKTGFSGTMCQNSPKCDEGNCKNGASCFGSPLGYACFCPRGWMGTTCETPSGAKLDPNSTSTCPTAGCGTNAKCVDGSCTCDSGYEPAVTGGCRKIQDTTNTGTQPPTNDTDLCKNSACENCNAATGKCYCPTGYSLDSNGKTCSAAANPCSPSPCTGTSAQCSVVNNAAKCACNSANYKLDSTGKKCVQQQVTQKCDPACAHVCNADLTCSCNAGFVLNTDGYSCKAVTEDPTTSTCANYGCQQLCDNMPTGPVCSCRDGWTKSGKTCKQSAAVTDTGSSSDTLVIVLIVLIVLVVLAAVGYFFYRRSQGNQFAKTTNQMYGQTGAPAPPGTAYGGYGQTGYGQQPYAPPAAPYGGPRPPPPPRV